MKNTWPCPICGRQVSEMLENCPICTRKGYAKTTQQKISGRQVLKMIESCDDGIQEDDDLIIYDVWPEEIDWPEDDM